MAEKEKKAGKNKKAKETVKPLKPVFAAANVVYSALFFGGIAVSLVIMQRPTESMIEQRKLAVLPEFTYEDFIDGTYTKGVSNFYNDTIPYRDELKKVAAGIKSLYGVSHEDSEIYGQLVAITEEEEDIPEETAPEDIPVVAPVTTEANIGSSVDNSEITSAAVTTTAPVTTTEATTTEKNINEIADGVITNGQVVTKLEDGHYWGISLFGGGKGTTYASALNKFNKELGEDVRIYSMVVPTAGEYYLPKKYDAYNASHRKSVDSINSQLNEDIIPVDGISALAEHTDEPIYTRTDHHWQALGAYYAAEAMAKAADVPFSPLDTYKEVVIKGYVGTMYTYTENVDLLNDPEEFIYYKPQNEYTVSYYDTAYNFQYNFPLFVDMPVGSSYSTFMGGDAKIVKIETDIKNGRKLLIFKDSYGNAEVPFYTGSFQEIYVCDMRYFDLNAVEFIKDEGITDLLFTMCTFSAVGPNANGLTKVLGNPTKAELLTVTEPAEEQPENEEE